MNKISRTGNAPFLPMRPPKSGAKINWLCRQGMSVVKAEEYYRRIAGAGVVATGRFHAVVFALIAGRPFVAVRSNTAKIESLLVDVFGSACRMTDVSALPEAAYEKADFSEVEAAQLLKYVSSARSRIRWMFDKVVERVSA
jgi:polysaccharide pyruvyl transferase WcaK-like protein